MNKWEKAATRASAALGRHPVQQGFHPLDGEAGQRLKAAGQRDPAHALQHVPEERFKPPHCPGQELHHELEFPLEAGSTA